MADLKTSKSIVSEEKIQNFVKQLVDWTVICSATNVSTQTTDAKWCRRSDSGFLGASWDGDVEGGAWDVVLAPLDNQDVVAPLL